MNVQFTFDPNLEKELMAWQDYVKAERKKRVFPSLTISREFGCEAHPLAQELQKRLTSHGKKEEKWVVLGKNLIDKIAEQSGIMSPDLAGVGNLHFIFQTLISIFRESHQADHFDAFQYFRQVMLHFARTGNSILVGRGAVSLTQKLPNCINIRLIAPLDFRIEKIMRNHEMSEAKAKKHIEKEQKQRDEFIGRFTGTKSLSDPRLYHLILNNAKNTTEMMAELIEHYLAMNNLKI